MKYLASVACLFLIGALGGPARAADTPEVQRQGEVEFLTGGLGDEEQSALEARAADYSLWLTVTAPGGAYLSGVDVTIADPGGKTILETKTRGPFLLVELPAGRYEVRAAHEDWQSEQRVVDVPQSGTTRVVMALPESPESASR